MIREYTFTGFYHSGNPFLHYYDETIRTMFTNSIAVATWDREPNKGDKIKIERDDYGNDLNVWINNELVFVRSQEKEKQKEELTNSIYDDLKRSKGLIP